MNEISLLTLAILVFEDDQGDFGLIQNDMHLAKLGNPCEPLSWARTLVEGIAAAKQTKPDIVLLDLSLPDSTGLQTVHSIRSTFPDIPLVVLTGQDDDQLAIAALQAGAQDYLVKGHFDHDTLGRAVRHALVRSSLERRLKENVQHLKLAENSLLDSRNHLNEQVRQMTTQMQELRAEFEEVTTTLKVLLKNRSMDKSDAQKALDRDISQAVAPFLQKLKNSVHDHMQIHLLDVLESNLRNLAACYGNADTCSLLIRQLTPVETQVALMIKKGLPTKDIATAMSLSPETIHVHRKHIRKKLGLNNKSANLRNHLTALSG